MLRFAFFEQLCPSWTEHPLVLLFLFLVRIFLPNFRPKNELKPLLTVHYPLPALRALGVIGDIAAGTARRALRPLMLLEFLRDAPH